MTPPGPASGALLPEVAESEAAGTVAAVYAEIREAFGLPLVNLVYRHLAAVPGRLEEAWRQLRPNLAGTAIDPAAEELAAAAPVGLTRLSPAAVRAAGVTPGELARAVATLDAYNHANPRNLLAVQALLHGAPGAPGSRAGGGRAPARASELLPMADLRRLDPGAAALLQELAAAFAPAGDTVVVPSLFRHFAHNPAFLALLWTALRPAVEGRAVARRGNVLARRARVLAAGLPQPVARAADPATREVLGRFTFTIAQMLVAGTALRAALGEALEAAVHDPGSTDASPGPGPRTWPSGQAEPARRVR